MARRWKPESIRLEFFREWRGALGVPLWRVMELTDLSDSLVYKAERALPISRSTARLLAIALEVPLELIMRVGPDHEDAREIVRIRAAQIRDELAANRAYIEARRLAFMQALPTDKAAA